MTVNKVLSLLSLFNLDRKVLTVNKMAELSKMPKSSIYRHIRVLRENDFLMEDSPGRYRLGYKFLEYANIVRSDIKITEISREIMNELTLEYGETTILSVLSNINAVCLATSTPNHAIKVSSEEGKIMPLYSGATSKAILAYQNPLLLDEIIAGGHIEQFTEKTLTEKQDILDEMAQIRDCGYAYSDSEIDEGVVSYGFPIRDSTGQVFASLAIAGMKQRMTEKNVDNLVYSFKKKVKEIEVFL